MEIPEIVERKIKQRGRKRTYGLYHQDKQLIEIDPRQGKYEYLDTVIHEGLHHVLPMMSEEWVHDAAPVLTQMIWASGYRKVRNLVSKQKHQKHQGK